MILKGDICEIVIKKPKMPREHTLLSNVKATCAIGIVISTSEELPKDRIITAGKAELPKAK